MHTRTQKLSYGLVAALFGLATVLTVQHGTLSFQQNASTIGVTGSTDANGLPTNANAAVDLHNAANGDANINAGTDANGNAANGNVSIGAGTDANDLLDTGNIRIPAVGIGGSDASSNASGAPSSEQAAPAGTSDNGSAGTDGNLKVSVPAKGGDVVSDNDLALYTSAFLDREQKGAAAAPSADASGTSSAPARGVVKGVEYTDDGMVITYESPAKFLGLFPTTLTRKIRIGNDGSVDIGYPWYGFLFATDDKGLKADIQSRVGTLRDSLAKAAIQAQGSGNANGVLQAGDDGINAAVGSDSLIRTNDGIKGVLDGATNANVVTNVLATPQAKGMLLDEVRGAIDSSVGMNVVGGTAIDGNLQGN